MFSLNEIWKCVLNRLVELNVLKDPDAAQEFASDDDSTELEEDFDYIYHAKKRVGVLFKNKRSKDDKDKSLRDMMPKNDFTMVQRMLDKTIEHEKVVIKLNEYEVFPFVVETRKDIASH